MTNRIQPSTNLLSQEENSLLFKLIGPKCKSLATAVVQVLFAYDSSGVSKWRKKFCGVLCFIEDSHKQSRFLKVYCLEKRGVIWEQELYIDFKYSVVEKFFHTFESDTCRVGLNFADDDEAECFAIAILDYLNSSNVPERQRITREKKNGKHLKKYELEKKDIGTPFDFKHIRHVEWGSNQHRTSENVDRRLSQFFAQAGITTKHLSDVEIRELIFSFIEKQGGNEATTSEISLKRRVALSNSTFYVESPLSTSTSSSDSRVHGSAPPRKASKRLNSKLNSLKAPSTEKSDKLNLSTQPTTKNQMKSSTPICTEKNSIPPPPSLLIHPLASPPPNMANLIINNSSKEEMKGKTNTRKRNSDSNPENSRLENQENSNISKSLDHTQADRSVELSKFNENASLNELSGALAKVLNDRSKALHSDNDSDSFESDDWKSDDDWDD